MATKWAICGAGQIAWDFCTALRTLPATDHEIVAIVDKDLEKAAQYASKFDIPTSFDNFDDVALLKDIDVVYIAVIHSGHVELSLKFIEAGKNVLCEKPMALSVEGAKKVLQAAKDKGVFFMEACWTRIFPAFAFLREQIALGLIGDLKLIEMSLCHSYKSTERFLKKELGAGTLMDTGCYLIHITNIFFKGKPDCIQSMINLNKEIMVDKSSVIQLRYNNGRFASLTSSSEVTTADNTLVIRGTKGNLMISRDHFRPNHVILPTGEKKDFPLPPVPEGATFNFPHGIGLTYEIQRVRECLHKGLLECPEMPHEDSLAVIEILCEVLSSNGVVYDSP